MTQQLHDKPKPIEGWVFGIKHILKPMPKFALRLGVALSAVSALGFSYTMLSDSHPDWSKWMGVIGLVGVFLSTLFAKK